MSEKRQPLQKKMICNRKIISIIIGIFMMTVVTGDEMLIRTVI